MNKGLKRTLIVIGMLAVIIFFAFRVSPYPSILFIRYGFDKEAKRVNDELQKFVPDQIESILDVSYDANDKDALFDVYFHKDSVAVKHRLPLIVWTHGGGLVSGNKHQLSNYCKILASHGYTVISIDYTVAPEAKYPTPVRQLNQALRFISSNANRFHADTSFFILAGDSGGSMISAATANIITNPEYATSTRVQPGLKPNQIRGLLLYCGIYEIDNLKTEGPFGSFLNTVKWAYFDKKDISQDVYAKTASVTNFLTGTFPPSFISAGNKDPLLPQSELLANKLSALKIYTDTLFYSPDYQPALEHEYQFTLDDAGKMALQRSMQFLDSLKVQSQQQLNIRQE